ncbi:MAG: SBBP repeat-containing protein [Pseudomonadota bacterium]
MHSKKYVKRSVLFLSFSLLFAMIISYGCSDSGPEKPPSGFGIGLTNSKDKLAPTDAKIIAQSPTDVRKIEVELSAKDDVGIVGYCLSEDANALSGAACSSVQSTVDLKTKVPFDLSAGAGSKKIYARFMDAGGNGTNAEVTVELKWIGIKQIGSDVEDLVGGIDVDDSGNVYVVGTTLGKVGNKTAGKYDIFIAKYDNSGNVVWLEQIGSDKYDWGNDIVVFGDSLYIVGSTYGDLDTGGYKKDPGDVMDAVVMKYTTGGKQLWVKQITSSDHKADAGRAIAVDPNENIYITGYSEGQIYYTLAGQPFLQPNKGGRDILLAKCNSSGACEEKDMRLYGSTGKEEGNDIALSNNGDIFVTGFKEVAIPQNPILTKIVVDKWAPDLSFQKEIQLTGVGMVDDMASAIAFSTKLNSVVVSGQMGSKSYIIELDPALNPGVPKLLFANEQEGSANDIAIDNANFYITGYTAGASFGQNYGGKDMYLIKWINGMTDWQIRLGSSNDDSGNALARDKNGNLFVFVQSSGDFNGLKNVGVSDAFIVKVDAKGNLQ